MKNLHTWSTTSTPPPKNPTTAATRSSRARPNRPANFTNNTPVQQPATPVPAQSIPLQPYTVATNNPAYASMAPTHRGPLPTVPQALQSSYASRLRTGATLLMQPILSSTSAANAGGPSGAATAVTLTRSASRRGGIVNYTEPGSGDDEDDDNVPDAGALDSGEDSDFVASGGTRTAVRQSRNRMGQGMVMFNGNASARPSTPTPTKDKNELDQSYLGQVPPERFIKSRPMPPTAHEYPSQAALEANAARVVLPVPIRVEFETDTHRIRDCFMWNLHESLITPESFARSFCQDLELPLNPWADTVAAQIRAQLEDAEGAASMALGGDAAMEIDSTPGDEVPECRVIISVCFVVASPHNRGFDKNFFSLLYRSMSRLPITIC
ncbi:hypothetical protein HGRIS_005810 [Hohenbuehelia grisea]|uniref:SNF5-domain-containing protein n=1 Tax=Hohenbuehelia grisea TaxID=104357 RepID=A0ABR3K025_9AGAR